MLDRPRRTALYMPASNARALSKAETLKADSFIFDLEDAVAAEAKDLARTQAVEAVNSGNYGMRELTIRINGLDTKYVHEDIAAVATSNADAILVPKITSAADVQEVRAMLAKHDRVDMPLWAMIETPLAVINVAEIAKEIGAGGALVMGTNDLEKDLHVRSTLDRHGVLTAMSLTVIAGRAYGLGLLDGVYGDIHDSDGLSQQCKQGRDFGFDGKTLIHPSQIETANNAYGPSAAEIAEAEATVQAFDKAREEGANVATLNGRMVEELHAAQAARLLAFARAIAALEQGFKLTP